MTMDDSATAEKAPQATKRDPGGELKNTTYELFIATLSIISIVNLLIAIFANPTTT